MRTRYALAFCALSVLGLALIAFALNVFVYVGLFGFAFVAMGIAALIGVAFPEWMTQRLNDWAEDGAE